MSRLSRSARELHRLDMTVWLFSLSTLLRCFRCVSRELQDPRKPSGHSWCPRGSEACKKDWRPTAFSVTLVRKVLVLALTSCLKHEPHTGGLEGRHQMPHCRRRARAKPLNCVVWSWTVSDAVLSRAFGRGAAGAAIKARDAATARATKQGGGSQSVRSRRRRRRRWRRRLK